MSYERSQVTLAGGILNPPKLRYDVATGHYFADMVSLSYNGNTYQNLIGPAPALGHIMGMVLTGDTINIYANNTEVWNAAPPGFDYGIDGTEDLDGILIDATAVLPTIYVLLICPHSSTASILAESILAGFTNVMTLDSLFIAPKTSDPADPATLGNYIFDLPGSVHWVIYVRVSDDAPETAVDSGDGFTFDLEGTDAEPLPAPAVYAGATAQTVVLIDPAVYTFNYGDRYTAASVTFDASQSGNVVLVSYRWKRVLAWNEEPSKYPPSEREILSSQSLDINGRFKVVSSGSELVGPVGVTLGFNFQTQDFWSFWQDIAAHHWTFDVLYTGNDYPYRMMENLFPIVYPNPERIANSTPQMVTFSIGGTVTE